MALPVAHAERSFGFLTVVEDPKHALFGGYLILNRAGRPLEFHCTAPVRPNRAQEILYGPTLRPYLYGEQIGRTLLEQGKHATHLVLTDCEPMLAVAEFAASPVALVAATADGGGSEEPERVTGRQWRVDDPQDPEPHLRFVEISGQRLALQRGASAQDEQALVEGIEAVAFHLDLAEPFERIRAAIDEARRGGQ